MLVVHSRSTVECSAERIIEINRDLEKRAEWDQNFLLGEVKKTLSDKVEILYLKTKKIAMVSSRDQVLLFS